MGVEKANIGDIPDIVELRLAYLREDNGRLDDAEAGVIQKSLPDYFQKHLQRDLLVYVVRENQHIVSCAFLLIIEKPMSPAFMNGQTGIVLNVYTLPSYRRRGYAEAILKTLLVEARKKELSVVELKSTEAGYSLYKKIGFSDDSSKYHLMRWPNP